MRLSEAINVLEKVKDDIGDVELFVDSPVHQEYGWVKNIVWSSLKKEAYALVLFEDKEKELMKVTGTGILSDLLGEYLIVAPVVEPSDENNSRGSFRTYFLSKRYFMEKIEKGFLAGDDVFMPPHWVSFSENWAFRIDWFAEPREVEIYEPENTV